MQYKAALAIAGVIQSTSREKIYQELELESLKCRRWYKRLSCVFRIMNKASNYLLNLIPKNQQIITTRDNHKPNYQCRTNCFKYFFSSVLKDQFNLNPSIRYSESIAVFKNRLLSFIRPIQSNVQKIFDPIELKLLTRSRLGCSRVNGHKVRHNFQDCLNSLCSCRLEIEDTVHYFLHCHHFSQYRLDLINNAKSVSNNFESFSVNVKRDLLLYGDSCFDTNKNKLILEATIIYIKNTVGFLFFDKILYIH